MSDNINYLPIDEFRDFGFLQELNRRFLHPMGLALEVRIYDEQADERLRSAIANALAKSLPDLDACTKGVMDVLEASGLLESQLGGVWDYRHDPEGILYGDDTMDREKVARVTMHALTMAMTRFHRLGFIVQDPPTTALSEELE